MKSCRALSLLILSMFGADYARSKTNQEIAYELFPAKLVQTESDEAPIPEKKKKLTFITLPPSRKGSEGFIVASYTVLSQTIIQVIEKKSGTAKVVSTYPSTFLEGRIYGLNLKDINGDGKKELIATLVDGKTVQDCLFQVTSTGELKPILTQNDPSQEDSCYYSPSFGKFNGKRGFHMTLNYNELNDPDADGKSESVYTFASKNAVKYTIARLTATKDPSDPESKGKAELLEQTTFKYKVPKFLDVSSGNAGNGYVTMSFDDITCVYQGQASCHNPLAKHDKNDISLGQRYRLIQCTEGTEAPEALLRKRPMHPTTLPAKKILLSIFNGDPSTSTTVKAALEVAGFVPGSYQKETQLSD